jgi:hypothetical protein
LGELELGALGAHAEVVALHLAAPVAAHFGAARYHGAHVVALPAPDEGLGEEAVLLGGHGDGLGQPASA